MQCPKCKKEISEDSKFCPNCGVVIPTIEPPLLSYARFWRRFMAFFIDCIVLLIVELLPFLIIKYYIGHYMVHNSVYSISSLDEFKQFVEIRNLEETIFLSWVCCCIIVQWLYFTLSESSLKQATFGKRKVGIIVTDMNGNRISFGRANERYWSKIFSFILFIGFIMAGFTKKKQALHDIMADTLVVIKNKG